MAEERPDTTRLATSRTLAQLSMIIDDLENLTNELRCWRNVLAQTHFRGFPPETIPNPLKDQDNDGNLS